MPDSPQPIDNNQRLALIQRLWIELRDEHRKSVKPSKRALALMDRIRRETDAFRAALDNDDPTKF